MVNLFQGKTQQNKLNNRPRKVLDMQTPKEVFDKLIMQNFKPCNAPKLRAEKKIDLSTPTAKNSQRFFVRMVLDKLG